MPSRTSIEAGRAFLKLSVEDAEFNKQLASSAARLERWGQSLQKISLGLGAVGAALTAPLAAAVKSAADAQESLSRFSAVFGAQEQAASKFADSVAKSVGRSRIEIRDGLATFQSFFVGLGFGGEKAREFSEQMQSLSIDFASFNNISDAEAMQRFISALSGSSEVLDRFGVNTKQAALQQELLRQGINKSWTEVTEQEKAVARLNIIMRTMTEQGSVGDAKRTAGSLTNQLKSLRATVKDLSVDVGTVLIPAVTKWVTTSKDSLVVVAEWLSANPQLVTAVAALAAGMVSLSIATGATTAALKAAAGAMTAFKLASAFLAVHPITASIIALTAAVYGLYNVLKLLERGSDNPLNAVSFSTLTAIEEEIAKQEKRLGDIRSKVYADQVVKARVLAKAESYLNALYEKRKDLINETTRNGLPVVQPRLPSPPDPGLPVVQPTLPSGSLRVQQEQKERLDKWRENFVREWNSGVLPALLPPLPDPRHMRNDRANAELRNRIPEWNSGILPALIPATPNDRLLHGTWINTLTKKAQEQLTSIRAPEDFRQGLFSRAQFGGKNVEQALGGDIDQKLLLATQETNKILKRSPIIRVGNA